MYMYVSIVCISFDQHLQIWRLGLFFFVQLQRHPEACFKGREQKSPTWGVQMRSHLIDKIPLPTQPEQ